MPVFLAQGGRDRLVQADFTRDYARWICAIGGRVRYVEAAGADHGGAARSTASTVASWIANRFNGVAAPDDCNALLGRKPDRWNEKIAAFRASGIAKLLHIANAPARHSRALAAR